MATCSGTYDTYIDASFDAERLTAAGDAAGAAEAYGHAAGLCEAMVRQLGADHPVTLLLFGSSSAFLWLKAGQPERAADIAGWVLDQGPFPAGDGGVELGIARVNEALACAEAAKCST